MKNELLDKGIILPSGEIGKDKINLVAGDDLAKHVPIPIEPEVFVKTWIFTHGIATIVSTNTTNIAPEEIRQLLTEACASFKLYHNESNGG